MYSNNEHCNFNLERKPYKDEHAVQKIQNWEELEFLFKSARKVLALL